MNPSPSASEQVLIAEDSPTQSLLLQNTLEKNGFAVTARPNGRAAFAVLASTQPALVITDIQMPEMDGYELCRRIKTDPAFKCIPVILLTSLSAPQDIIQGLECGADNFVVKPYREDFLLARIRTVLANRELDAAVESAAIPVQFAGQRYQIAAGRRQILNLLLSTYETAVMTNQELIKAQEALKAAQAQLIEAEKLLSVGRLAAGAAHEVRNPLAILEMGMSYLAGQPLSEDGKMVIKEMQEAVLRANAVITGLMNMASPHQLGMIKTTLHQPIENALQALRNDLSRARVEVVRRFFPDLPESEIDVAKIEQVFVNVITNALHAMPDGGTLTVATGVRQLAGSEAALDEGDRSGIRFRKGERVVFAEVSDTGGGIAPENLGKLFEPFFSTKPTGQGMGLGLTVVKKIMDLHHGRIEVRNREAGGAIVTLVFKMA